MSSVPNGSGRSSAAEDVLSASSPNYSGPLDHAQPVHECESLHVGRPRSAFHDLEGELQNHQLAQHRVQTSRLLSGK